MKSFLVALTACLLYCINLFSQVQQQNAGIETNIINFEWMPDGQNLVLCVMKFDTVTHKTVSSGVYSLNLKSKEANLLISDANNPSVSPDGTKLAFGRRIQNKGHIYVYNLKDKSEMELSKDTDSKSSPQWSPDGQRIVYTRIIGTGRTAILDIFTVDIQTGVIKEIAPGEKYRNYNPVWNPNGKSIVFYKEKGDGRDQIFLTNPEGTLQKNITNDTATHNFYPSWYSDKKILYTLSPYQIATINVDGSNRQVIKGISSFFARKSPREEIIGFISMPENVLAIYDIKTQKTTELLDKPAIAKLF